MLNLNKLYLNLNNWDEGGIVTNININNNNIIIIECEGPEYYIYKLYINIFDWLNNYDHNYNIYIKDYNIYIESL